MTRSEPPQMQVNDAGAAGGAQVRIAAAFMLRLIGLILMQTMIVVTMVLVPMMVVFVMAVGMFVTAMRMMVRVSALPGAQSPRAREIAAEAEHRDR